MIEYPYTIFGDAIQVQAVVPSAQIGPWTDTAYLGVAPKGANASVRVNNTIIKAGPPPTTVKGVGAALKVAAALGDAESILEVNKLVGDLPGGKKTYSGFFMAKSKKPGAEAIANLEADADATLLEPFTSFDDAVVPKNARFFGLAAQVAQGATNLLLGTILEAPLGLEAWVFLGKAGGGWKKVDPGIKSFELKGINVLAFAILAPEEGPMPGFFRLQYNYHGA